MKNKILNYQYDNTEQAIMPQFFSEYLDILDPVITFDKLMEGIDISSYIDCSRKNYVGRIGYNPVNMFKTVLFGFMDKGYILNWIAVPVENRLFSIKTPVARRAKRYLIDNFGVNVNAFDLITGYRADDSYFDYAESFLNNSISVEQLVRAMHLGKLGEQIVIKSQFAFSKLSFEGFDIAEKDTYYVLRKARDDEANRLYTEMLEEESDGLYIQDIMRGGIKNNDPRIPRNISE